MRQNLAILDSIGEDVAGASGAVGVFGTQGLYCEMLTQQLTSSALLRRVDTHLSVRTERAEFDL